MTNVLRRLTYSAAAIATFSLAGLLPASATTLSIPETPTTIASYSMSETGGTVMYDGSSGRHNGYIGSLVRVHQYMADGKVGYEFPGGSQPNTQHSNTVTVKAATSQNPGSDDLHIQYYVQTTQTTGVNFLQKGQAGAGGGFYKVEMTGGKAGCYFSGSTLQREAWSTTSINDGRVHKVDCYKTDTYIEVVVDGANPVKAWGRMGSVYNYADLSIGGKETCTKNADGSPNCDYFSGYLRGPLIQIGPETD